MFTRIIVPLDGSDLAQQALPQAVALAQLSGARVLLFAVVQPTPPAVDALGYPIEADPHREEIEKQRLETHVKGVAHSLSGQGLLVEWKVAFGNPAEAIVQEADAYGANLIIISTHGRGGLGRLLLGSVADHLVRHASMPVLLVRATGKSSRHSG